MRAIQSTKALYVLAMANFAIAAIPPGAAEADPLVVAEETVLKQIERDCAGAPSENTSRTWLTDTARRTYAVRRALRDFFSGTPEQRASVAGGAALHALADRRYVVEKEDGLRIHEFPSLKSLDDLDRPLAFVKRPTARVTVFQAPPDRRMDLSYLSLAFVGGGELGIGRWLRSPGPYEQFLITLELEADKARVIKSERDEAFKSRDFVSFFSGQRISRFVERELVQLSPQERARRLPQGADVPFPGKAISRRPHLNSMVSLAEGGEPPAGPWQTDALLTEKDNKTPVPERFDLVLRYDHKTDVVEVVSCKRDAERKRVADFVWEYLQGDDQYRSSVRAEAFDAKLPATGKIAPYLEHLDYSVVSRTDDGTWHCTFRVLRSGIPGAARPERAQFECELVSDKDGKLTIIKEQYSSLD